MPFKKFSNHPLPDANQLLWRYMDFARFVSLVQLRSLYFASLKQLLVMDPWEGAFSKPYLQDLLSDVGSDIEDKGEAIFSAQSHIQHARSNYFVNCWHINVSESDAQWKIYGREYTAIAVITSFEDLCNSIVDPEYIFGSKITYYKDSFSEHEINGVVTHKRDFFSHENEFRLIHSMYNMKPPDGLYVKVDLQKLMKEIVVSPLAPTWFINTVQDFLIAHNLNVPVRSSVLGEKCPI